MIWKVDPAGPSIDRVTRSVGQEESWHIDLRRLMELLQYSEGVLQYQRIYAYTILIFLSAIQLLVVSDMSNKIDAVHSNSCDFNSFFLFISLYKATFLLVLCLVSYLLTLKFKANMHRSAERFKFVEALLFIAETGKLRSILFSKGISLDRIYTEVRGAVDFLITGKKKSDNRFSGVTLFGTEIDKCSEEATIAEFSNEVKKIWTSKSLYSGGASQFYHQQIFCVFNFITFFAAGVGAWAALALVSFGLK